MATELKACYGRRHENENSGRADSPDILRVLNIADGNAERNPATKGA